MGDVFRLHVVGDWTVYLALQAGKRIIELSLVPVNVVLGETWSETRVSLEITRGDGRMSR